MSPVSAPQRVLVVSASPKFQEVLRACLPPAQFQPLNAVASGGEAKRALLGSGYDLVVIDGPVGRENGAQLALDIASQHASLGILLLVRAELFDQACARVETKGIVTLPKPTTRQMIYTAAKMLTALRNKLLAAQRETLDLRERMEEIRIVNKAKWFLIENRQMSEPEAHLYIEKAAMDRCIRKKEIAEELLRGE